MMKTVAVLLAVYHPDKAFFQQQLRSLNAQTYANMRIYICDDSADVSVYNDISQMVQQELTNHPYILFANVTNLGSNQTFERLTQLAQADYVAYCDQDDVWHAEKIEKQVLAIEQTDSTLVYSHLRVIDANNQVLAQRFSDYNQRIKMVEGEALFSFFIRRNCVTGCTLMMLADVAKQALPFSSDYVHDHWLALCASAAGKITLIKEALVDYRLHGNNQIGKTMLHGVDTIEAYRSIKLQAEQQKLQRLLNDVRLTPRNKEKVQHELTMVTDRMAWFDRISVARLMKMCQFYKMDKQLALFEMGLKLVPKAMANRMIKRVKE